MKKRKIVSKSSYINKLYFGTKLIGSIALFEWIIVFTMLMRRFLSLGTSNFYNKLLKIINNDISKYNTFIDNSFSIIILIFLVVGVIYLTFEIINYVLARDGNVKIEKWLYVELFLGIIFMLLPLVLVIMYNYV